MEWSVIIAMFADCVSNCRGKRKESDLKIVIYKKVEKGGKGVFGYENIMQDKNG